MQKVLYVASPSMKQPWALKMLKFAFIIFKYFPYGGMQRDMLRTALTLTARGHHVDIYTMAWQGEQPAGLRIHVLAQSGWLNYKRYQAFIRATFEQIDRAETDFIVGYNRMQHLDAHFAADPCFIERATHQRNWLYRLLPRVKWFAECERAIFAADASTDILAVSLTEKTCFQHWYGTPDERFHYIPPFLSSTRFALQDRTQMRTYLRQAFAFGADDFVYLLTGSGFHMKGLDRVIHALAALPPTLRAHTRVVAVGQDNPRDFQKLAHKLGVADLITIAKGRPDIPQLMQGADVCVHPARRENTGLVILEGMACATPMLVTDTCGYAHFVLEADAGLVCTSPYQQTTFNQLFAQMRVSPQLADWGQRGLTLAQRLMQANDGCAEADILERLATQRLASRRQRVI